MEHSGCSQGLQEFRAGPPAGLPPGQPAHPGPDGQDIFTIVQESMEVGGWGLGQCVCVCMGCRWGGGAGGARGGGGRAGGRLSVIHHCCFCNGLLASIPYA